MSIPVVHGAALMCPFGLAPSVLNALPSSATLDGWNDAEDREVICVLGRHDAALMTGSMHESNI